MRGPIGYEQSPDRRWILRHADRRRRAWRRHSRRARTFAQRLGRSQDVELLEQTLEEESMANELLTEIAESGVNQEAVQS